MVVRLVTALTCFGQASSAEEVVVADDLTTRSGVAAVSESSVYNRFALGIDWAGFGKIGDLGLAPQRLAKLNREVSEPIGGVRWMERGFRLSGQDLYRLSCRSCHGAAGQGLQPHVPPLSDPIRAISPMMVSRRMAERGRPISDDVAKSIASRAEATLRQRLREGGHIMPPFAHLDAEETKVLLGYLQSLVGVPAEEKRPQEIDRSAFRIGELVTRGVCLICHNATERYRSARLDRDVPNVDDFVEDYPLNKFVRKVRTGLADADETPGRMPSFKYLTHEELSATYIYLAAFPPKGAGDGNDRPGNRTR